MEEMFFSVDIFIAIGIPMLIFYLKKSKRLSEAGWWCFIAGILIGSTWEIGFYFAGPHFSETPIYTQFQDFPGHPLAQTLSHSVWDGGLFMIGYWLVVLLVKDPFQKFQGKELGIMMVFGGVQELIVELVALYSRAWTYNVRWWNPSLFEFGYGQITPLPQLIWFVAPMVFYWVCLFSHTRFSTPS